MSFSENPKPIYIKYIAALFVATLLVILVFGLNPKDFRFSNNVIRLTDQPGIRFDKYGIAFTRSFIGSSMDGFSIEIALKPLGNADDGFNHIFTLHNGKDSDQLIIGQWLSWIIIMNGDDYAHKRGTKRIAINIASPTPIPRFISITTGQAGSRAYMNGHLIRGEKDLFLRIPRGDDTRLILGNSVSGKHSWKGDVYGLAFYRSALKDEDVLRHFSAWSKNRDFVFAEESEPMALYIFNGKNATMVFDRASGNFPLEVPMRMQILKKDILSWKWSSLSFNKILIKDMVINLIGFIPFGFFLFAWIGQLGGGFKNHPALLVVGIGFMVSMGIEITQAWMPSRSSQIVDLTLNTIGTCVGVFIYQLFFGHNRKISVCKY